MESFLVTHFIPFIAIASRIINTPISTGQEHLTTNIFVGNLDPCTTEEELTDVFREFGETIGCDFGSWRDGN